jgi:hypothetical protein
MQAHTVLRGPRTPPRTCVCPASCHFQRVTMMPARDLTASCCCSHLHRWTSAINCRSKHSTTSKHSVRVTLLFSF